MLVRARGGDDLPDARREAEALDGLRGPCRSTCSRSLAAPEEMMPKRICSAARPAMATTMRSCRCCCEVEGAVLAAVEGEPARVAAGEDGHPLRLLVGGAELGGQDVAGLVPGDDLQLALGDAAVGLLGTGDAAQHALVEVLRRGWCRGPRGRP